jgi:predicted TIM-barrel fold metal-dependent hydrolase
MLIVDAQVHVWGSGTPLAHHRQTSSYSVDDLLKEMDEGGVDAAIIHPPGWDPNSAALALEAARRHPNRLAILGKVPVDDPQSASLLPGWRQQQGMLGLRLTFLQPGQADWPTDGTMDWLWPAAEEAGVPVALMASNFLPTVGQVAERHPGLKLIVDHLGRPSGPRNDATWGSLPALLALAKYPNVAVKATGAPSYSSGPYPYTDIHDYIHQIFDAFGPSRTFWGTDITRMPCPWSQCVSLFTEELPWLSESDKELVMGRAVCEWLDWKLPS